MNSPFKLNVHELMSSNELEAKNVNGLSYIKCRP